MARDTGQVAAGGVIRDEDGKWILGFNHYLGNCNPLEVGLWGIMDGILIMIKKGFNRATIQTNNLEVVNLLTKKEGDDSGITVLKRTQQILRCEGQWQIQHVLEGKT